jgi:nucleoside-diphosphate-sugar epimerase
MEQLVRESGLDWCIVRGASFYGPGTGRAEAWRSQARGNVLVMPGDGNGFISLIHVVDMATALVAVAERGQPRHVYIAADDQPTTYRDLLGYIGALEGGTTPTPGGQNFLPSFRVSNAKLKALGWAPAYPSFRSGLAA